MAEEFGTFLAPLGVLRRQIDETRRGFAIDLRIGVRAFHLDETKNPANTKANLVRPFWPLRCRSEPQHPLPSRQPARNTSDNGRR